MSEARVQEFKPVAPTAPWVTLGMASLVAFTLRIVMVSVGPVVPSIQADLGLNFRDFGILLSTPLALIALLGIPGGRSSDRWGAHRVLSAGVVLLAVGALARGAATGFGSLWLATIALGLGLGVSQSALPRLVHDLYPGRMATATGVYSGALHTGAAIGAYTSGSILLRWLGWRGTFWLWGGIAAVTAILWLYTARQLRAPVRTAAAGVATRADGATSASVATGADAFNPVRSLTTWLVAMSFGLQATIYFALSSWLPSYYHELGWDLATAGVAAAGVVIAQVPAVLLIPYLSDRTRRRKPYLIGAAVLLVLAATGLMVWPLQAAWVWPVVAGTGTGTIFALCLGMPADLAPPRRVGATAGFVITAGYVLATSGPYLLGAFRQAFGSMTAGMALVLGLASVLFLMTLLVPETARRRVSGVQSQGEGVTG